MMGLASSSESLESYREGLGLKPNVLSSTLQPAECQSSGSSPALLINGNPHSICGKIFVSKLCAVVGENRF